MPGPSSGWTAGGEFHEGQREAFHAEWEEITGWTVEPFAPSGVEALAYFQIQVQSGTPEFDVYEISDVGNTERICGEGLCEQLDYSYFPIEALPADAYDPDGQQWISLDFYGIVLVWNTEVFPEGLTSAKDLFDREK